MKTYACDRIDLDMPRGPRGELYRCGRTAVGVAEPRTDREWFVCNEHAEEAELDGVEVDRDAV